MFISKLQVEGYKNARYSSNINLNKGLNILVGENGCGKTAIINSLRLILRESESHSSFSEDDFYCSMHKNHKSSEINIDITFSDLSENEKITFLTWCTSDFNAYLHLIITENPSRPYFFKRKYWGGHSLASIFEEDTFDRVECIYLPPLRDAEARLSNGRNSRLAHLIKKQYGDNTQSLVENVRQFNNSITQNKDGKYSEINFVRENINSKIEESLGKELGQSINLQFSEITFNKIIQNIRMVFFPHINETDIDKFRDLATNSLGYNNLLYIATVFSELELIKDSDVFTVLLIEEPEAHLHPQLQVKFIKYLEDLVSSLPNSQIIVSTHSPILASSVGIRNIIHISDQNDKIIAVNLNEKKFGDELTEKYINRWLDVTKSTMLFSRGIILVEGIAEALILPCLGKVVLKDYNDKNKEGSALASSLEEMGISIININGINFNYFMKLFGNFKNSTGPNIPIYCAGLTDRDPLKENGEDVYPTINQNVETNNPINDYIVDINGNEYTKIFMSPLKTLEYDIAMYNPVKLSEVIKKLWPTQNGEVTKKLDEIIAKNTKNIDENIDEEGLRDSVKYIYKHIEDSKVGKGLFAYELSEVIGDDFIVPEYIKKAILWACGGIEDHE